MAVSEAHAPLGVMGALGMGISVRHTNVCVCICIFRGADRRSTWLSLCLVPAKDNLRVVRDDFLAGREEK